MVLDRAADGGVTFIDSFDVYPFGGGLATVGRTEEILGRLQSSALADPRSSRRASPRASAR